MLSTVPADIVFQVVQHLSLADAISLLLTCTALHELASERNFWILILTTARARTPIGATARYDLSNYTLAELQNLVASKLKLEKNWSTPQPRLTRPITSGRLSEAALIIHSVQGTDILLLYVLGTGDVYCWDKKETCLFPGLSWRIPTGGEIMSVSAPCDSDGVSCESIALVVLDYQPPRPHRQIIITVRHKDGKAVAMEYHSAQIMESDNIDGLGLLFISSDVTGCLTVDSDARVWLSLAERADQSTQIMYNQARQLYTAVDRWTSCCFTYRGHIYNALENDMGFIVLHLSRNNVQARHYEQAEYRYLVSGPMDDLETSQTICSNLPSSPVYGICAVFARTTTSFVSFTFIPCDVDDTIEDNGDVSMLTFPFPFQVARVLGALVDRTLIWLDHSGCNVATVIDGLGGPELKLVRYHPAGDTSPASTSEHGLEIPDGVDLTRIKSCCVDDTSGTVHLVDDEGTFYTLNYA